MLVPFLSSLALIAAVQDANEEAPVLQLDAAPQEPVSALVDTAGDYAAYHSVIADLRDAPIGSANDLDDAMDRLTAFYSDERLVRAWIAYTAMIAARHPEYLDDVRELADYYGPEAAMSGLMYDPAYATSFTHASDAQASVVDALDRDTAQIREVSERYRAAAYDLQTGNDGRWARVRARDRQDRLDAITNAGEREISVDAEIASRVTSGVAASELFQPAAASSDATAMTPQLSLTVGETRSNPDRTRIGRILSVAALEDLSADPQRSSEVIDALLSDPVVERCLAWVRLDLQQCVAAGHYKYEDSFCIAEHALLDVSRCLGASSQASN
ncbi:hypothetical protein [Maricaulis sp.]|uniref:hypothetical protein n=1 Tax=Maricaulis sp. TaxID=1486257 RepID=UPI0026177723|nr:hypothetical protein [Maricaulis sp.]